MKTILMKGRQGRLYSPYLRGGDTGAQRGYLAKVQVYRNEDTKSLMFALCTSLGLPIRFRTVGLSILLTHPYTPIQLHLGEIIDAEVTPPLP